MKNQTLEEKFEELYLKGVLSEWDKAIKELDEKEAKSELKKKHKSLKGYIILS
ncbi:hypothetical protein IY885_01650 [Campylobacter volucris]|uniref:hypothetical protein n=1 Tax=Campylobacter volucris TaxID=1031542 RepID=UPI0018A04F84|nr:hypothetical protein [Campylobacter volucris]MBF7066961.1 hypothetical protein [Campylobacter volucris]MBF7069554.1 hypothetical protein [Campylobacter volucris]